MKSFGSMSLGIHFNAGYSLKRLAFGISLDRYSLNVDFAFFWFSIEF